MSDYSVNRTRRDDRVRVVVHLPPGLVEAMDQWGVSSGKTSRRETTEALLRDALKEKGVQLEAP